MRSDPTRLPGRWLAGGVAVGAFLLYFFRLGAIPLLDPDEPVYGQIAREMVTTGNWLTPHLAGKPWFDKPPLFYWASAAAMSLFGPTELAARLPSALAAALLALLVLLLGRRLFGRPAGWAAAVVLATSLQTIILGRAAVTDMLFALTLTATLACFARWYEATDGSRLWAALCGASLGLAVLCKGPVAIVLVGATALVFLLWERRLGRLLSLDALVALFCCLVVAGPWYAAMLQLHRQEFVGQFIIANNLQRFSKPEHRAHFSPLYFVPVLLVGLFPWSVFLPRAVGARGSWAGRLFLTWSGLVFLFFSASSTKLVTYIYPLYPAVALLIGATLGSRFPEPEGREPAAAGGGTAGSPSVRTLLLPVAVNLVFGILMAVGLVLLTKRQYPAALSGAGVLGALLLAGTAWGMTVARRGAAPMRAYAGMMVGVAAVLGGLVAPQIAPSVSLRELVRWADRTSRPLVGYRLRAPGFLFYAGRELPYEREPAALAERARAVPNLAVAMSRRALPELAAATPELEWRVIWRRGNRVVAEPIPRGEETEGESEKRSGVSPYSD
jgi:4-amino-4-deoxy-L-arabinose transferase-like glycosyltransferase